MFDLLVTGGLSPTGPAGSPAVADVGIADGRIAEVAAGLDGAAAKEILDASGCYVLPGLVDAHVHVSGRFGRPVGLRMLVRGGVTAALDLAGDAADLQETLPVSGCGLTVGALHALIPGDTVPTDAPGETEIEDFLDRQLERGALGLKVLGGHFPLTPDSTRTVIEVCARRGAYCAVHAGTTATGSDVTGVEELIELADGLPVHVAHVNSYCRGQIGEPLVEATRALAAIGGSDGAWSESYLSVLNGAEARCADGVPESGVVRTCLGLGGFDRTETGLEQAIAAGWGRVQTQLEDGVGYLDPEEGVARFRQLGTDVGIGFPVNPPAASLALALARDDGRAFVIDGLASDGGSIPRNSILEQGIALVRAGFLSLSELVLKASAAPAQRLCLSGKGRLEPGADADVIVAGSDGICRDSVIAGAVVMRGRQIVQPGGGRLLS